MINRTEFSARRKVFLGPPAFRRASAGLPLLFDHSLPSNTMATPNFDLVIEVSDAKFDKHVGIPALLEFCVPLQCLY